MKYVYSSLFTLLLFALVLVQGGASQYAYAHGDEEHKDSTEATLTLEEMEDFIGKLRQIIQLLTLRNQLQRSVHTSSEVTHGEDTHADDMMEDHHAMDTEEEDADEHTEDHDAAATEPVARLIIELEEHNDQTHVHIRYTDKPEDMFFVGASLNDTDGIVEAIHERSGLVDAAIRAAITYPGTM